MTYVKQTWANGVLGATPINAARLNHIEDGLEAATLGTQLAHTLAGADYGAKVNAAVAALPSTGGTIDCRGFTTAFSFTTKVILSKPVTLLLPNVTHTYTGAGSAYQIASNGVRIKGGGPSVSVLTWLPNDYVHTPNANQVQGAIEFLTLFALKQLDAAPAPAVAGTSVPIYCLLEDFYIYANSHSAQCGVKWLASYSKIRNVAISISGYAENVSGPASAILVLGHDENGTNAGYNPAPGWPLPYDPRGTRGTGSYYNFFQVTVGGSGHTSALDEMGIRYAVQPNPYIATTTPNANFHLEGRVAAVGVGYYILGNANKFYGITTEAIRSHHYLVDGPVANATTRITIDTPYMEGGSGANGVTVQGTAQSTVLREDYGTSLGAGLAWNDTTAKTQNNVRRAGYGITRALLGPATTFTGGDTSMLEIRSADTGNRTNLELHAVSADIIRWVVRASGGGGIVEFSRVGTPGEYRFRAPVSIRDNSSLVGFQNETDATRKTFYYAAAPYGYAAPATDRMIAGLAIDAAAAITAVMFGGTDAPGSFSAATVLKFFTASAINTASGTLRWQIGSTGMFFPGVDATYDIGFSRSTFRVRDVNLSRNLTIGGALDHYGTTAGFYGTTPIAKPTGVAVDAASIHAALVSLGLIAA